MKKGISSVQIGFLKEKNQAKPLISKPSCKAPENLLTLWFIS